MKDAKRRPFWTNSSRARRAGSLDRDAVRWAYRLFLDREPNESEDLRRLVAASASTADLRRMFLASDEFRRRNPHDLAYTVEPTVVIAEIAPGLRLFLDLSDVTIGLNIARRRYEESEMRFVRSVVRSGEYVLDIGANVGFFTVWMASLVGPHGHVFAYEPLEQNALLLERSLAENGLEDRVTLRRDAVALVSGESGMVFLPLEAGSQNSGGAYLVDSDGEIPPGHRVVRSRVVSLDGEEFLRPIRFIKIDVEGAEPLVFRGARRLLEEDRPVILCEINPEQIAKVGATTARELIREMASLGFECRLLGGEGPGEPVEDATDDRVRSVVFAPRSVGPTT
jgi:FkbM family methyltransferase